MSDVTLIAVHRPLNPAGVACALEMAADSTRGGSRPVLVQITNQGIREPWSLRAAAWNIRRGLMRTTPDTVLRDVAVTLGIEVRQIERNQRRFVAEATAIAASLPTTATELETIPDYGGLLGKALLSWLVTSKMRASPEALKWGPRDLIDPISRFLGTRDSFRSHIRAVGATSAVLYNARLPEQVAPLVAAEEAGLDVRFWNEQGALETGVFFCEPYRPHERHHVQRRSLQHYRATDPTARTRVVEEWLTRQQTDASANRYLQRDRSPRRQAEGDPAGPFVTFFTSSPDELVGLVGGWDSGEWSSQEDAFTCAIRKVNSLGMKCLVRVHPNLINKSWREYVQSIRTWSSTDSLVVLPTDPVDSYRLARESLAVFVWSSTIGLEASALGKPVFCMGPTSYDEIADVRRLATRRALSELKHLEYRADPGAAAPAVLAMAEAHGVTPLGPTSHRALATLRQYGLSERRFESASQVLRFTGLPRALARGPSAAIEILSMLVGRNRASGLMSTATRLALTRTSRRQDPCGAARAPMPPTPGQAPPASACEKTSGAAPLGLAASESRLVGDPGEPG